MCRIFFRHLVVIQLVKKFLTFIRSLHIVDVVRVSEVYAISIFRVEVSRMSMQQIHRGRMAGRYGVQINSNNGQVNVILLRTIQ